jgi:amino acid adenylation domain-containing protein
MTYNGRPETASGERGVGLFLNSVPMCANVITGTWKHLIEHLTQVVTTSMAYRHYPLARIQEDLNTYLGEVTFNYTHFHIYEEITRRTGENHLEVLASYKFAPNSFDLNVDAVRDLNDHLSIILVYNPGVFDHALIEQMAQFYLRAFELMLERIDQPHHAQSLLSEEEIRQQLFDWNATTVPSSDEFCIHQHIEIQAAKTPNAVAVIFENQSLSYHEMNAKADRLARYLLSAGVQMNSRVGLCLRPSLEMMIGILGVMKAGAAYVPLEPRLPMERVKYMLKNAGVEWVLVDSPSRNSLPPDGIKTVLVDAVSNPEWLEKFQDGSLQVVQGRLTRENLAYVLYTSGSTGNPKGVMVPHRALSNYLAHAAAAYLDEKIEGAVVSLPLCFDATLTTLLSPLLVGKPVELLPENETALSQLAERLFKRETGWLFKLTPAHLEALEHVERPSTSLAPHMLVIGGEQLSVSTLRRWKLDLLPNASFVNEYGPTETVVGCTTWTLQGITDVAAIDGLLAAPIGRPIRNVQLYVLGEMGQLLPNNSVGELYIGGDGLARGYLNEPALTQEQFVPSPFCHSSGSRLYRTGDMVRWLPSGQMTFVGRRDNQVKIRGFRIELGEIEQQLCGLPGVDSAAVMVREDMPGGRCLTAYVVPADYPINEADRAVIEPELVNGYREALSARLPEYMIPSKFILLNNLPITQNKKIDRKALAALADLRTANHHDDDPRDDTELFLKSVWEEILQIQNISRKAKFFEIGGHSINAITLAARLAKTYHKKIRVQVIFEHPTIEQLAAYLRQEVSFSPPGSLLVIQPRGSRRPLFCVHPGGGLANCYLPLSRSLGMDQPLYGLQSYGLEDGEAPLTNIEEMAARYLGEMRTVQPQGPYQILGYSGGVIVAYEMVQQLAASGEQMPLLILIDGILPPEPIDFFREGWEQEINEWKADYIRNVLEKAGIDEKEIAADDFDAKVETYLKKAKNQFGFPDDITVAQFKRFIHLFATNIRAQLAYRAKTYLGPVHFFFANNGSREMLHHYGWGQMFMGDVCCHSLPGTHEELVDGSNAAVLGEELMPLLDQTELRLAANSAV